LTDDKKLKVKPDEGDQDDEVSIDFSKVKSWFKGSKKSKGKDVEDEDSIDLDFKRIGNFFVKNKAIFLIIIPLLFAIFLRATPAYLPATENWAESATYSQIQEQIRNQINQQYPNLPEQNKQNLIDDEFSKILKESSSELDEQIKQRSDYFKSRFQDDSGQTYLLAIDPYHYYRMTNNYLENGHTGTANIEGEPVETFILAPAINPSTPMTFHMFFGAFLIKLWDFFGNSNPMAAFFWLPVIIASIAIIPAYIIGRRFAGDLGGFFTALVIAIAPSFLTRTAAGFSDTDAYNVMFPLLILMFVIFARDNFDNKKWMIHATLAGLFTAMYMTAWTGWWYVFVFVIAALVIALIVRLILNKSNRSVAIKNFIKLFILYLVSGAVFSLIFKGFAGFASFWKAFLNPLNFATTIKAVATTKIWPNVYTTVAELNEASLSSIINSMGGNLLFLLALLGILLVVIYSFKKTESKNYNIFFPILLIIWFIGTIFASTKGMRFTLLLVPAFGLALGCFFGIAFTKVKRFFSEELKVNKYVVGVVLVIIFFLLLGFTPAPPFMSTGYAKQSLNVAQNEVPSMNDAWFNTLDKINKEAPENSIINSWWDFGHWFKAIGNRPVTFDGGSQNTPQAHWMGRALLTNNEKEAVGILKMLDCGGNTAFDYLHENVTMNDSLAAVNMIYDVLLLNDEDAVNFYKEVGLTEAQTMIMLKKTHCVPPENYFITSQDMVGKAGVWSHFGSWDFKRASAYNLIKEQNLGPEALLNIGLSEDEADDIYNEVLTLVTSRDVDTWIAPWPNYVSGPGQCQETETNFICINSVANQQVRINLSKIDYKATFLGVNEEVYPISVVYPTNTGLEERKFSENIGLPYSMALVPNNNGGYYNFWMDPVLTKSTFTKLFFYDGHGTEYFNHFSTQQSVTGDKISVWTVDWDGHNSLVAETYSNLLKASEQVYAKHILVETEEEANSILSEIETGESFEELALKNSKDAGSAPKGGELGWFKRGMMVKPFEDAAFALNTPGEISKPIETQFGWHIIKLVDKK
jgi:dolichyl-phosphooligosaccharide-protein glycotransferase